MLWLMPLLALAAPPERWISRGPGGGGAFFGPVINPYDPREIWVGSDMGDLFLTRDTGLTWETVDFRVLQGGSQAPRLAFTSDPGIRYALHADTVASTTNAGATWAVTPAWQSTYVLFADPGATNRLIVSDYTTLYISTNAGRTFEARYTGADLLVAGTFWDGQTIYVGTKPGLLVSTNNGASFYQTGTPGIPASHAMVSFAGAREGLALRFFCITYPTNDVYPGMQGSVYANYGGVYRMEGGTGSWTAATSGIGANLPYLVAMCPTNVSIAYGAGSDGSGQPSVVKTVNGGTFWTQVMRCTGNANVVTGWSGDDTGSWNWRKWSFGECALGFTVCASDVQRAVITDLGFIHITTNGGATWQQAYSLAADANPTNTPTSKTKAYHGIGIEDTSCWWLEWFNSNTVFASFTDIRGMVSTNGGAAWMIPMTLSYNSTYQTLRHPSNGTVYAAASSVHDLYAWDRYCKDASIGSGSGAVLYSTNNGLTWAVLKNLGRPVVGLALDPNATNTLYATMVNAASGGVYRTTTLGAGTAAAWTRLTAPPRTVGHPYQIVVLRDGTLVCSYSAQITTDFTATAGVFVSTNAGASWLDRSATGMRYYTKDVIIDPADPGQNRWYAGVWGEWGSSSGYGGLYVTTNRGVAWSRLMAGYSCGSCTPDPVDTNEMYVATELDGLWVTTNRMAAAPTFIQAAGYPFRFPSRVFLNPWNSNEAWATSFGNGLRMGRRTEPRPVFQSITPGPEASSVIRAASGQRLTVRVSTNLLMWQPHAVLLVPDNVVTARTPTPGTTHFVSATVE